MVMPVLYHANDEEIYISMQSLTIRSLIHSRDAAPVHPLTMDSQRPRMQPLSEEEELIPIQSNLKTRARLEARRDQRPMILRCRCDMTEHWPINNADAQTSAGIWMLSAHQHAACCGLVMRQQDGNAVTWMHVEKERATAMSSYTALSTTALRRELGPELSVFAIPVGVKLEFYLLLKPYFYSYSLQVNTQSSIGMY
ncbi:hypothetical protein AC578_8851 [Pseudocercospora eumusae]|uniref:Uncharacterized protein n=1 Tax=Pseudocercospora eumusae TaxID=321146 RepID=A0A139H5G8_9PEZI|nr:hypothetical protein AC578_8851 [Pseudocercospora eumusae]